MIAPSKVAKKTTKAAEVPPEDPRSRAPANTLDCSLLPVSELAIAKLQRHPHNRHPTAAAVDKMVASIQSEGLLEPPVVRPLADGNFQIISGETRVLALRKLKRPIIVAKVLNQCTDARALELLAIFNAERTDLNPIEKAVMIQRLCEPPTEGGAGMTREQAAKIYGLESGSAASNLVGLLKLPKCWQDVVASGEFPYTFARILIPYAPAAAGLEGAFKKYQADMKSKNHWDRESWESRDEVERSIDNAMDEFLRPLEKDHRWAYGSELFKGKIPKGTQIYGFSGNFPCLFQLTPELEAKLGIVELQIKGVRINNKEVKKPLRYATNVAEYDKLQIPLIIARVNKDTKKAHGSAGEEKTTKPKKLSPAEEKKAAAERKKQLQNRIELWRHAWLKKVLADAFSSPERCPVWQAQRFAMWLAGNDHLGNSIGVSQILEDVVGAAPDEWIPRISQETLPGLAHKFAAACFSHIDRNPKNFTAFETQDLEVFARDLNIDLAAEWLELPQEDLAAFLELFQGAQLEPLAKEWDIFLKEGSGRKDRIKLILGSDKKKPLPKCVPAIAAGKKGGK